MVAILSAPEQKDSYPSWAMNNSFRPSVSCARREVQEVRMRFLAVGTSM